MTEHKQMERTTIMASKYLIDQIDEIVELGAFPNRSEAIRNLLLLGTSKFLDDNKEIFEEQDITFISNSKEEEVNE